MQARSVKGILEAHRANSLLNHVTLPRVPEHEKDLRMDQPTTALEPDVIDSTVAALESGQTHYVDVPGITPLREALVSYLNEQGIQGYDPAHLVVTASMQEARFLALQALAETAPSLAIPEVVHPGVKQALGVRPPKFETIPVDRERGLLPSLDGLREVIERGVKVIYLESPMRLTGAVFEAEAVQQLNQLCKTHEASLIWDQGLSSWVIDHYTSAASEGLEHVTLIGEVFPGAGLEGMGLGFIATQHTSLKRMTSLKQIMSICTSTPSQYAALKISETYEARRAEQLGSLQDRFEQERQGLEDAGQRVLPGQTANLVAFRVDEASAKQLSEQGFDCADGGHFGAAGVLRLALNLDSSLEAVQELVQGNSR